MNMAEAEIDCEHGGTIHSCPVCIRERKDVFVTANFDDNMSISGDAWFDATTDGGRIPAGGFEARYESDCPECESRIEPGEMIFMRDGRAVCEVCA